jgi:hypothetical protein
MGKPQRKHANGLAARAMPTSSFFFISLIIILNVSSSYQPLSTMAITTRSTITKEKPISRALIVTATTPFKRHQKRRSERLARSPQTSNVNNHLAKINRPSTRLDNVLKPLCPQKSKTTNDPNDTLNAPRELMPPTDRSGRMTPVDSPTGVDVLDGAPQAIANNVSPQTNEATDTQSTPPSRSIRINETETTANSSSGMSHGTPSSPGAVAQGRQSILLSSYTNVQPSNKTDNYDANPSSKKQPSEIYDQDQKLYRVFSDDGMKETAYHITDFTGFYPVWPIVEFSMTPTGATKDKQMISFIKCVTALLGEMLHVDDMPMIALINITDDNPVSCIKTKADLPTNFTKLGKHSMISGGNWVFNKKE